MLTGAGIQRTYEERIVALLGKMLPRKYKNTKITAQTELRRHLGIDSLGLLSLLFNLEKEFKVDMSNVDLAPIVGKLKTVGDLVTIAKEIIEGTIAGSKDNGN